MESIEVVELFSQIDAAVEQEEYDRALRLILANFDALADPAPLRERIADVLARTDRSERAVAIYKEVGSHYMNSGHPARVLAVIKEIEALGGATDELVDRFTALYNRRSPFLDTTRRHAGIGVATEDLDVGPAPEVEVDGDLVDEAARLAANEGHLVEEPADDLPPLPLLSELPSEALEAVVRELERDTFDELTPLDGLDDAEPGMFWTVSPDVTLGEDDPTYHLRPGTLVGVDHLVGPDVTGVPPAFARNGSEILRLRPASIEELAGALEPFRSVLEEFARRGAVEALVEDHAMFEVIPKSEREKFLEQFEGLEVEEGTKLVRQDSPSPGLFLIVDGQVDVVREDEDWEITVETLGAGDVFGEVGLVSDRPTPADVVVTRSGHVLHLPSAAFEAVAAEQPELAKWAVNLAQERIDELESTLSAQDLAEITE